MSNTYYRGILYWEEAVGAGGRFQLKSRTFKPYRAMNILNGQMTVEQRRIERSANRSQEGYLAQKGLDTYVRHFRREYERTKGWEHFTP